MFRVNQLPGNSAAEKKNAAWRSSYDLLLLWECWILLRFIIAVACNVTHDSINGAGWRFIRGANTSLDIMMEHARINSLRKSDGAIDALCAFKVLFFFSSFVWSLIILIRVRPSLRPLWLTFLLSRPAPQFRTAHLSGSEGTKMEAVWQYTLVSCFHFFNPCRISSRLSALVSAQVRLQLQQRLYLVSKGHHTV